LSTENGLSQFSVNALYRDERGFIWIGTREGLNCYNGNDIKIYKLQKNDSNSLFCNNIYRLTGDQKGKVFALCTDGLAEYNIREDKFRTIFESKDAKAVCYYNDRLYVSILNKIYLYDEGLTKKNLYYSLPDNQPISCFFFDNKGDLYIGSSAKGVYLLEKANLNKDPKHIITKGNITSFYQDSSGDIWAGSWENGLFQISAHNVINHLTDSQNNNSVSSNFVRTCCEDNQGNIWIGTFQGLDKYNKETKEFAHFTEPSITNNQNSSMFLNNSSVWCMIKDHQGTLWIGTYFGGISYFNPEYQIYTQYSASLNKNAGLSSPFVGKMVEDNQGNIWICTEGGGLNVYNRKNKTFKWYRPDGTPNSISENNVKAIYFDRRKNIVWLGTHLGGLNKLDVKTEKFTHYRHIESDSASIPSDIIRDIVSYKDKLVVGTEDGVCLFDPQSGKSKQLFKDSETGLTVKTVADLYIDHRGVLWIATEGEGIFSYDFDTNKLKNYRHDSKDPNSLSNNNINSINQDHFYNLWIATSGRGLDLYRYDTDDFVNYDSQDGLSSDCVYNVCEARFGSLLVITNQGFSRFSHMEKTFYNYNIENGFPLNAITQNGLYQTRDGEIFLGGVKGMVSFYEKDLYFTKKHYNIVLTRLIVNDREVTVNDKSGILTQSMEETSAITLKSNHAVFSVAFTATNYIPANKDEFEYKLEGFSDEWIRVRGQNIITYSNLDPGKYNLIIRNKTSDESYITTANLHIRILPPFYKTFWAYLIYLVIIAGILYYVIKSYNEKVRLTASLEYEQKHLEDVEMLNQSKLRFFTNISHEFRTPLTLIIGQLEMLLQLQTFTPTIYNKVLKIYRNSLQLKYLISELLDFRKQEQGHMKIKVAEHDIVEFLYGNYLYFLEYANSKGYVFNFYKQTETLLVWYDLKQMQKVVNNLLSNAFKYTQSGESISINIYQNEDTAVFEVADTGRGIDIKDIDHIFNHFYQAENSDVSSSGTGIGLALVKGILELHGGKIEVSSKIEQGTVFKVSIPLGNKHFSPDQIQLEDNITESFSDESIHDTKLFVEQQNIIEDVKTNDVKSRNLKLLVVEDNETLREMLVGIFEPYYQVIAVSDGLDGLTLAKEEMPSIILSDVMMPKMTGIDMCKAIKSDIETCHIPVVLLTAKTAVEYALEGLRIGADDYITKPFNVNILISRCNNLVNSRIILQEKFSKQPQVTPQMLVTNPMDKALLDKALTIVEKYIEDPGFNVNVFASEMCMSRTNLFSKIKAVTGQTPNDFITIIRLKKAALLLKNNPDLNITDISTMTGFSSRRYFSKCFKDFYNIAPLAYRNGEPSDEDEEDTD